MATAAKKAGRDASDGLVDAYIHLGGKVGVLVEVSCESDFVAKRMTSRASCATSRCILRPPIPSVFLAKRSTPKSLLLSALLNHKLKVNRLCD